MLLLTLPALWLCLSSLVSAHSPRALNTAETHRLRHTRSLCSRNVHCILNQEATEGPFYIPSPLLRSNITEDRPGLPLTLHVSVLDVTECAPADGVWVDIWHADASGVYSGWASGSLLSTASPPAVDRLTPRAAFSNDPEDASRWLRGVARTDESGEAVFNTIVPAWYYGRTTHIHIRIHTGNATAQDGMLVGAGLVAHTGQLFFADELVLGLANNTEPYASHRKILNPILNGDDGIYLHNGGAEQVVSIDDVGGAFVGKVTVGIDPTADHGEDEGMPGGPGDRLMIAAGALGAMAILVLGGLWTRRLMKKRAAAREYAALPLDEGTSAPAPYHDRE